MVTVTEVGGDEPENVVDRVGMGTNENAAWVNAPGTSVLAWLTTGAWIIHPVMILIVKILVDAIPGMTQDVSWTVVNLGYMAVGADAGVVSDVSPRHRRAVRVDPDRRRLRRVHAVGAD